MATLTVRGVPETEKEALRVRAAKNGRSMEAELRVIVREALKNDLTPDLDLATAIRRRFEPLGGVSLEPFPETPMEAPPKLP